MARPGPRPSVRTNEVKVLLDDRLLSARWEVCRYSLGSSIHLVPSLGNLKNKK